MSSGLADGCRGVAGGSFGFAVRCGGLVCGRCGVFVGSYGPAIGCAGLSGGCSCGGQLIVVV
jgi:hypothetical protein